MGDNVVNMKEAARRIVAAQKGTPVSNRKTRTAAQEEAVRLRTETAVRESGKFGRKQSKALTDDSNLYMADDSLTNLPVPTQGQECDATMQLNQIGTSLTGRTIMEEIQEDRMLGKLRPFVEGEPIGAIQQHPRVPAQSIHTRRDIMDQRQKALRERQERNDATLERMIERLG